MSFVLDSEALAGMTEPLTRIGSDEQINFSISKRFAGEGLSIRPDRNRVQESRFHFRHQVRNDESVPLTESDWAHIWDTSAESELIASVSGKPFHNSQFFGIIHIVLLKI